MDQQTPPQGEFLQNYNRKFQWMMVVMVRLSEVCAPTLSAKTLYVGFEIPYQDYNIGCTIPKCMCVLLQISHYCFHLQICQ